MSSIPASAAPPAPVLRVVHSPAPRHTCPPRTRQTVLPLDWALPGGAPAEPPAPRHLRVVRDPESTGAAEWDGLPHPGAWVARLGPAVFEVIAGERPIHQLTRWASRDILTVLARRHAAAQRHPAGRDRTPPGRRAQSVRVQSVAPGVIEATVVVRSGPRCRALAMRLEVVGREKASGPRWLLTACDIG